MEWCGDEGVSGVVRGWSGVEVRGWSGVVRGWSGMEVRGGVVWR